MDWARRAWNGFLLVAAVLAGNLRSSGVAAVVLAIIGLTGLYRSLSGLKSAMPWFTEVRLMRFQNLAVVLARGLAAGKLLAALRTRKVHNL